MSGPAKRVGPLPAIEWIAAEGPWLKPLTTVVFDSGLLGAAPWG
jgi:hypothetical protein